LEERRTWLEAFLDKMGGLIPWERLEQWIAPFHPRSACSRRPYPLGAMLRVQLCCNLSDPGMEGMPYEV